VYTKQPARIAQVLQIFNIYAIITFSSLLFKQVLRQVYPVDASNVDDELVESIQYPAQNPNASEVFYRFIAFIFSNFVTLSIRIFIDIFKIQLKSNLHFYFSIDRV